MFTFDYNTKVQGFGRRCPYYCSKRVEYCFTELLSHFNRRFAKFFLEGAGKVFRVSESYLKCDL